MVYSSGLRNDFDKDDDYQIFHKKLPKLLRYFKIDNWKVKSKNEMLLLTEISLAPAQFRVAGAAQIASLSFGR